MLRQAVADGVLDKVVSVWVEMHERMEARSRPEYRRNACSSASDFSQLHSLFTTIGWLPRALCRAARRCVVGGRRVRMITNVQGFQLWVNPKHLSPLARAEVVNLTVDDGSHIMHAAHRQDRPNVTAQCPPEKISSH